MNRIVVLGVGNLLRTDDGVGVRVIQELEARFSFPPNVRLYDGGTGGLGLLSIIEEADYLVVVDSVLVGEPPGTVVSFDVENLPSTLTRKISSHEIDVLDVLDIARRLGKLPPTVIVGIQPQDIVSFGTELKIGRHVPALLERVLDELKDIGVEATPC